MEYYDESVLLALAAVVGRPIKVDFRTIDASRGRFARVCVKINLYQPVVGRFWFCNHWFHVEYEGLHLLCKKCYVYGHLDRNCTTVVQELQVLQSEKVVPDPNVPLEGNSQSQGEGNPLVQNPSISLSKDKIDLHGEWFVVSKNKRPQKPKQQKPKNPKEVHETSKDPKSQGAPRNRFESLAPTQYEIPVDQSVALVEKPTEKEGGKSTRRKNKGKIVRMTLVKFSR